MKTCLILQRMECFCKNEPVLEDTLNWCLIRYRYSRCSDGEKHKPEICSGACTKINFLLPIMVNSKRKTFKGTKKKAFFVLICLEFPFIFEEMLATFFNFRLEKKNWGIIFCK